MDQRRSPRVSIVAELTYEIEGISITKRVSDLSEGGLFVDTPVPSDVGTRLKVRFVAGGVPIEAEARVVFSQPFIGMGVEFTRMSAAHREAVRRCVARLAPALAGAAAG